jgi:hydrogenase maturation protease
VLACGSPDRGDDALGPEFAQRAAHFAQSAMAGDAAEPAFDVVVDRQFQIEHALDILGRERVLFVDATAAGAEPYACAPVTPARDRSFSTHALSPGAVLAACATAYGDAALPPAEVLAIRGYSFGLGEPISAGAQRNLQSALGFLREWSRS